MTGKTHALVEFLYHVYTTAESKAEESRIAENDLKYVFERNSLLKNYQMRQIDFKADDARIVAEFTIDSKDGLTEEHLITIENQLKIVFNRIQRLERFTIKKIEQPLLKAA